MSLIALVVLFPTSLLAGWFIAGRVLRPVDEIAYVRFASVYRKFADKAEFLEEMKKLLE